MFPITDIVNSSNRKSFERGRAIAEDSSQIHNREFVQYDMDCEAFGEVRSTSGIADAFHCSIEMSLENDKLIDARCDCPAFRKYDGLCKHCVALALTFKSKPETFDGYTDSLTPKTSRNMRFYLQQASDEDAQKITPGDVHLDVQLIDEFGKWYARFKIRRGHTTYIVSDVSALARAICTQSYFEYGNKLGFIHSLDAFDDQTRALAQLIGEIGEAAGAKKDLRLKELDVGRLLSTLGESSFHFVDISHGHDSAEVRVEEGDPKLELTIRRAPSGGYEMIRNFEVTVIAHAGSYFVFTDERIFHVSPAFSNTARFLHDVYQSSDDEIFISNEDIGEFCRKILPALESNMKVTHPAELEAMKPAAAHFSFYLDREGRGKNEAITIDAKATYGKTAFTLAEFNAEDTAYRDKRAELAIAEMVGEYFDEDWRIPLDNEESAGVFLYGGLAELGKAGTIYTTPTFDRLLKDDPLHVQIGLSINGNLIDLDVHSTDVSKEELAQILSSVQRKKHFHRMQSGEIASLEDLDLRNLEKLSIDLGIKPEDIRSGKVQIPAYNAFFLDREYSEAFRDEAFEDYIDRFDNASLHEYEVPKRLKNILRPYQVDGYRWLCKLDSIGFGGILADEMGLGKSLQMITYIESKSDSWSISSPVLIISPASLVYNWVEEFEKFTSGIKICAIDGTKTERRRKRAETDVEVFVASYDTIRMDIDDIQDKQFSVIVLDEAQYIKNQATKTSRAVRRLHAEHRFALTGTPIENRLSEIWSIFDFLMPGFLGTYSNFKKRFEIDIMGGDKDVTGRLQSLIEPFVLRRLKEDVLEELPSKQESITLVHLESDQEKLYLAEEQSLREALLEQRRTRKAAKFKGIEAKREAQGFHVDVLAELMRLRQVALDPALVYNGYKGSSAKTNAIRELIQQTIDSNRKALVFSQFTRYLDVLKREFDKMGVEYYEITGTTDKRKRIDMVNSFNIDDVPVFLISLKAGGTGLNLVGASVVIHADPWWNAAAIDQATDRAHRIGQKRMVSVYKMIAKGTIEERILKLQEAKRDLASSIITESEISALTSMTREELESLLLD